MEYQFSGGTDGQLEARFSSGHEAIGNWLMEDLQDDRHRLQQILRAISELNARRRWHYQLIGREYSLRLDHEEAEIRANALGLDPPADECAELALNDDQLVAGCGLEDFEGVLRAWQRFLAGN